MEICLPACVPQGDTSMTMDTDSNPDEEGAEESRDGQDRPSPSHAREDASARAVSAPCSPSGAQPGTGPSCSSGSTLDCAASQKASGRPNSLPPSSPRALPHNDWAYNSAFSPVEHQHPGMQRDKGSDSASCRIWSTQLLFYVQAYAKLCCRFQVGMGAFNQMINC